jgi:L-ribulokinase
MVMQIYADIIRMPIRIAGCEQAGAYGAAMFGAVAAGAEKGGYSSIFDAARALGRVKDTVYMPNEEHAAIYDRLYAEYKHLHDYFGRGENDVMKHLKMMKHSGWEAI